MKKTLSLILALLMSVSCASFAFADDAEEVLLDDVAIAEEAEEAAVEVEEPTIYQEAIDFLNAYGIYKGYGADKMGANDDIQRYQMALFTSRIATGWVDDAAWNTGIWDTAYTAFTDVNEAPAANYLGAISYANQNGIIEGYGDGRFGPTDGITYQNALTMVVRALGYQNLNWPWGYIEKAVNLGLTAGIVDVAYTDVLTRGEVAQVIYNALFAETKDGTTLGAKNFGIEFGWETIIITASDGAWFIPAEAKAADKKLEGIVAYKIVESDGTLSDDTYYTAASTFGFEGHQDELAVGNLFKVCFNKDGILFAKSLYVDTLWNFGPETTEVKDYFDEMTAVSKYTETTYVKNNGQIAYKDEVIVAEGIYGTYEWTEVDHEWLAIDWDNGNILKAIDADEDGKIDTNKAGEKLYEVAWYYNALLDQYYKIKTDKADGKDSIDGNIEIVGIDILDEKDVEELLKALNVKKSKDVAAFALREGVPVYSAYASLELFDLNGHDYGVYTSYRFGKIAEETNDKCGHGNKQHLVITDLSGDIAGNTLKVLDKAYASYSYDMVLAGQCRKDNHDDCRNKEAWWTDDYAPELDEEGKIETNYVIYNFNRATNELRVVKTLEAQTGVLRAYNLDKRTINIDGETFYFDYDALEGSLFAIKDDMNNSSVTKAITAAYLRNLFNQFVEYVVVDGKIVYVRAKSAGTNNYIVVESYAGVSNDGYIVVNAYSTADLKLKQYKIGSYNGWEKGDYFYYLDDETARDSFTKGVIYGVKSYDADDDAYYVELVGEFDTIRQALTYTVNGIKTKQLRNFALDADGYITYTLNGVHTVKFDGKENDPKEFKASSDDKWIIIGQPSNNNPYVPMAVYTGKVVDPNWTVSGDYFELGGARIIVNAFNVVGFNYDTFATGFVVYMGRRDATVSAKYDMYDFDEENDGYYLLGASTYEAIVFDLLTGSEKVVPAQNVKLKKGYCYITLDGKIVDDEKYLIDDVLGTHDLNTLAEVIPGMIYTSAYADTNYKTADYLFGRAAFDSKWINNDGFVTKEFSKFIGGRLGMTGTHTDLVSGGKVIALYTEDGVTGFDWEDVSKANNKYWVDNKDYACFYIYNVKENTVVIYVSTRFEYDTVKYDDVKSEYEIEVGTDAYIDATADIDVNYVNGDIVDAKLKSVTFFYDGKATTDTHFNVGLKGYTFGLAGECTKEAWNTVVTDVASGATENVYGTLVEGIYEPHAEDVDDCDLIKAVTIDFGDKAIAIDTWTTIEVTFSGYKGGTFVQYDLTVCAIIEDNDADGKLELRFAIDKNAANTEAGVAFANYIAKNPVTDIQF